ncbi:MAG: bifunctional nuclease family protein [Gemmatimonadota bacterium]|nr:bifunctional nuclease family protein [Gemmatimonadota bacterium]
MVEVRVQSLGLDQASKSPVVLLQEVNGSRVLPIWIGAGEAQAIAAELAEMKFSRPLTHDLTVSIIRSLGASLHRVNISRVEENTYYAELVIVRGSEVISMDCRPSDSIAIALRMSASIFASETLFVTASQQPEDGAEFLPPDEPETPRLPAEALQEYLKKLNPEDLGRFNP